MRLKIGRWVWLTAMMWCVTGCASGSVDVVEGGDQELLREMTRFEVEDEDLQYEAGDTTVYATLTRPKGEEDVPAIVLVAGSGPTDRDWNNPLLPGDNGTAIELSERLARAGIAVLRYDKRGTGHTVLPGPISWDDYLEELQAAVEVLRADESTDENRIFVAGHSEGGAHVLRATVDEWIDVDGVILLATAGRQMDQLVIDQVSEQLQGAGLNEAAVQTELTSLRRAMDAIAAGDTIEAERVSDIPGLVSLVETLQTDDARQFASALLPWDPARAIAEVASPILIINGMKDTQVDAEHDARRLHDAAQAANRDVQLALIQDADHVLKHQSTPRDQLGAQHSLVYNDPTRSLDEGVIEVLARWIYEFEPPVTDSAEQ